MDFYDELCQAIASDGAKRGVRTSPEEFQKFLSTVKPQQQPQPLQQPARAVVPDRMQPMPPMPQRELPPENLNNSVQDQISPAVTPCNINSAPLPGDWESLRAMVLNCQNCPLARTRQNAVFGEGDLRARLMFIGEGPGAEEDASGRPFVGAAGQLLDKMIAAMHLAREDVYIANIVKCRPPGNRMPGEDEAAACIGYLKKQIELVQPEVIVLLGGTALHFLLQVDGITRYRGRWQDYNNIPVMPTFHPAFLLRKAEAKREAWHDLKLVMAKLGISI